MASAISSRRKPNRSRRNETLAPSLVNPHQRSVSSTGAVDRVNPSDVGACFQTVCGGTIKPRTRYGRKSSETHRAIPRLHDGRSNPSDAPLTSRYYAYEVSVRVDCEIYVGRYVTAFNYLPSAFTADRLIPIRLTKHVMYFDLPNDPDLRMGIVRRRPACDAKR